MSAAAWLRGGAAADGADCASLPAARTRLSVNDEDEDDEDGEEEGARAAGFAAAVAAAAC